MKTKKIRKTILAVQSLAPQNVIASSGSRHIRGGANPWLEKP